MRNHKPKQWTKAEVQTTKEELAILAAPPFRSRGKTVSKSVLLHFSNRLFVFVQARCSGREGGREPVFIRG